LISAIYGLKNCYSSLEDAAQHQRDIESLQRQIDQLQHTMQQLQQLKGGGKAPAPVPPDSWHVVPSESGGR
jgi:hypothetical protein